MAFAFLPCGDLERAFNTGLTSGLVITSGAVIDDGALPQNLDLSPRTTSCASFLMNKLLLRVIVVDPDVVVVVVGAMRALLLPEEAFLACSRT